MLDISEIKPDNSNSNFDAGQMMLDFEEEGFTTIIVRGNVTGNSKCRPLKTSTNLDECSDGAFASNTESADLVKDSSVGTVPMRPILEVITVEDQTSNPGDINNFLHLD